MFPLPPGQGQQIRVLRGDRVSADRVSSEWVQLTKGKATNCEFLLLQQRTIKHIQIDKTNYVIN